ncbi:MEDS domain-containing protein [Catellatospora sp. NPDC049111]|uniref:MEDS domain-containing protein n=1 Tax=Catellatospora sp. NPDC049111 TaxID=3155271 RepID=UPI0033EFD9D0
MRRTGFVDAVDGLGRHDHICWVFDTLEAFRSVAGRFLADGLAAGQQVIYLADAAVPTDLDHVDGFAEARSRGAARVQDLGIYEIDRPVDPLVQAQAYAQATEQSIADGYTGLRVAAEVTPLVRTPAQLAAFTRYEHLVDAYMVTRPFAAMCGYDSRRLSADTLAELACMHPLASRASAPLRLFPSDRPGITAALAGEVDLNGRELLAKALRRARLERAGGEIAIDAGDLAFLDHRGLFQLVEHIRAQGASTVLHVAEDSPVRLLADTLRLPDVRLVMS